MGINVLPIIEDMLAERRAQRAQTQYQAKHGAGLESQEEMQVRSAMDRHPSFKAKHGKA